MRRVRNWLLNILLVVVSFGIVLGAAECYLRYTRFAAADFKRDAVLSAEWSEYDQLLGFVRKPNVHWTHKSYPDKFAPVVTYETDENGFRNPPGVKEADIAFIGDSFTEGGSMVYEQSFPRLVEKSLGKPIINLGRGSYGPVDELVVLWRYVLQYSPRTVVWVLFEGNDITDAQKIYGARPWDLHLPDSTDWSTPEVMWFDDIQLHELAPSPTGDDWYYRAAPFLNLPDRFPEHHITGENLMRNGDFAAGTAHWEISESMREICKPDALGYPAGTAHSMKITIPASMNLGVAQVHRNLKPSTSYLLTGYIKTENVLGPARLEVQQREGDKYTLLRFTTGVARTNDWMKLRLVFTTPDKPGEVRVFLRRPTSAPAVQPKKAIASLKLAEVWDVALHQSDEFRKYWGLTGIYESNEFGPIEVGFRYKYVPSIDAASPQGWRVTDEVLRRGYEICRENDMRLLIVYLPQALRVHGPFTQFAADAPVSEYVPNRDFDTPDEFARRTEALCAELGVSFIDATPALRDAAGQKELVYSPRYDTHLYYRGHEIVADLIADTLQKAE